MRIQVLTHTYPRFEGDTHGPFVEDLCEAHVQRGHDVNVLTAYDPEIDLHRPRKRVELSTYRYAWPSRFHVLGYSRTLQADVRMKLAAKILGPSLIASSALHLWRHVRRQRPDVIHAHWIVPNGFVASMVGELTGIPVFVSLHGSDVFVAGMNALYRRMAVRAAKSAAAITSCSPELTDRLSELGARVDHVRHVPYGYDPGVFAPDPEARRELRSQLGMAADSQLILALGRFVHKKGFEFLLRAAPDILARHSTATLVVAGGGELDEQLRQQAAELRLGERIKILGAVTRDKIADFFSACDVFVMPSVRDAAGNVDGLPVVIVEAMAAAKPVIASNLTGIPLAVVDRETGILVPPRDVGALANAISELLADRELATRYGEAGRTRVKTALSWETIAALHREMYRELSPNLAP